MKIRTQDSGVFQIMDDAMMRALSRCAKPLLALLRPAKRFLMLR
jgi:hypothetical protein